MSFENLEAKILEEPLLEFGFGQSLADPHEGLATFGPCDINENTHRSGMCYGLISTRTGRDLFERFFDAIRRPIAVSEKVQNAAIWPMFPGFEAVFGTRIPAGPSCYLSVETEALHAAANKGDRSQRVGEVVDLYLEQIRKMSKMDERFDVIYCVVPDFISKNCRPKANVKGAKGRTPKRSEIRTSLKQMDFFDSSNYDYYMYFPDFRRQIKARAMEFNVPIQIILESTLAIGEEEEKQAFYQRGNGLTPLSDRAWNLSTTTYYKIGGKPWKLASVRDGVCYVGLCFKMTGASDGSKSACCAAQMFLQDGDGVVFKGDEGVIHSPEDKTLHLSKEGAKKMLSGVLKEYADLGGKPLKEVFIHCPSEFSKEEFEGFQEACPSGIRVIAVRVKKDLSFRLYRNGTRPVVRGTYLKISDKEAYLWGSGFKYELGTYDGTEIPMPLRISVQFGDADIETVARDILGLSKLNYNACKFSESAPVTVGFSGAVGEILVSTPTENPRPQFKFYI